MKILLRYLLKGYLFWLLFFFINRLIFAVYNFDMMDENGVAGIVPAFWYGLRLDLSLTAYLMLPTLFFYIAGLFKGADMIRQITGYYFILCMILVAIISTADLQLYREWGTKINSQVFAYISHPKEMLASSGSAPIAVLLGLLALQILLGYLLYRFLVKPSLLKEAVYTTNEKMLQITLSFLVSGVSILLMRGGLQLAPMNQSFVYYSSSAGANQCAVNASWNLFYYMANSGNNVDIKKYSLLKPAQADSLFAQLYKELPADSPRVLFRDKPNIILVILESFTADGMAELGGENLMPQLSALSKEALLFENAYASGDRTDKGLAAILSGFPAQPASSIITEPSRYSALKNLPKELTQKGYTSSFIYGGEVEFANMKAYLLQAGFGRIIDRDDFAASEMNSKWGAHDEAVFDKSLQHCRELKSPFFHSILTLSSHEPFDAPGFRKIAGANEADMFRNSVSYTDSCIGDYIRKASREPWFDNSIFIFVADHGHRLIANYTNNYEPGKFRIPLLVYGNALNAELRGKRISKIASQTDIAATVLEGLGLKNPFKFSRSLMSEGEGFAFYAYNDGLGWVRKEGSVCFDYVAGKINHSSKALKDMDKQRLLPEAQAYMQKMIEDYSSFSPQKR